MATIGTGMGSSIIVNGQIVNRFNYTAGEVGYIPVDNSDWQSLNNRIDSFISKKEFEN